MKRGEAEKLATQMAGLFPGAVNQAHRKTMITAFMPRERKEIEVAIARYHHTASNLNWIEFWEACDSSQSGGGAEVKANARDFRMADHIRRTWPQVRDKGDVEVIVRHYHNLLWREKSDCRIRGADPAIAESRYQRECRVDLMELRTLDYETAKRLAANLLVQPHEFQAALDDIRMHFPGTAAHQDQAGLLT